jgi:hypothetical protein
VNAELLDQVIRFGVMAADMEALATAPPHETGARYTRRLVETAIRHLVKAGLLEVAPVAAARLEAGVLVEYKP